MVFGKKCPNSQYDRGAVIDAVYQKRWNSWPQMHILAPLSVYKANKPIWRRKYEKCSLLFGLSCPNCTQYDFHLFPRLTAHNNNFPLLWWLQLIDQTTSHYDEPYQAFEYLLRKQKYFSIVGRKTWFLSSLRFKAMSNMWRGLTSDAH